MNCEFCNQPMSTYAIKSDGISSKSIIELHAISKLGITLENNGKYDSDDEDVYIPSLKLKNFVIYDQNGHLVSIEQGLIEKGVQLFASGTLKCIKNKKNGLEIIVHDIGPIKEWWINGFDGGKRLLTGITSKYSGYYLKHPNYRYLEIYKVLDSKVKLLKIIMDYLIAQEWNNPNYRDFLQYLILKFDIDEDIVLENGSFICGQVQNYDSTSKIEEQMLLSMQCMQTLANFSGFKGKVCKLKNGHAPFQKPIKLKRASCTNLVHSSFKNMFTKIELKENETCGICEDCQIPDCGNCINCKTMTKFGGLGEKDVFCKRKKCHALPSDIDSYEEESSQSEDTDSDNKKTFNSKITKMVQFFGKCVREYNDIKFYSFAQVGNLMIENGSFVILNPQLIIEPQRIFKVEYIFLDTKTRSIKRKAMFHAQYFLRGNETILGETADSRELFSIKKCTDLPLGCIVGLADVRYRRPVAATWNKNGGMYVQSPKCFNECSFYYNKCYEPEYCRFVDVPEERKDEITVSCRTCIEKKGIRLHNTPRFDNGMVIWKNKTFAKDTFIFYENLSKTKDTSKKRKFQNMKCDTSDDVKTELYRKNNFINGSNKNTPNPYCVGLIRNIYISENQQISVRLIQFVRPEDISKRLSYINDWNCLYITESEAEINFKKVVDKCDVVYGNSKQILKWCSSGPHRFYYSKMFSTTASDFFPVPNHLKYYYQNNTSQGWPVLKEKLKCMDLYSGAGGLSLGLQQSGLTKTKWAIEQNANACNAFKLNNPDCICFNEDCNDILEKIMSNKKKLFGIPHKGEVDVIVGGPPCQGFSSLNRCNKSQFYKFKNSQVITVLSFVEYYRPKYFIFENVMRFVSNQNGMVLKLFIKSLLDMDYQITFGVLQAGHYGVPQNRRRLILIAAAPNLNLPQLPQPQHVFNKIACHLSFEVDNIRYFNRFQLQQSAHYRTITVYDAISDLPSINLEENTIDFDMNINNSTNYQRRLRKSSTGLCEHVIKPMAPLTEARIILIPKKPGADWRDLPNKETTLRNGIITNLLEYNYRAINQDEATPNRGVCRCITGEKCSRNDKQKNTIIPWSLVHTADKHMNWAGLFGRVEWDGYFSTTLTKVEPMNKQGRVLHPSENRLLSVRECARSQGFPDNHQFFGNINEKYSQIGNAVPPPLAYYIGVEIIKSIVNIS